MYVHSQFQFEANIKTAKQIMMVGSRNDDLFVSTGHHHCRRGLYFPSERIELRYMT